MSTRSLKGRLVRSIMALAIGGSALQVSGCDPAVRDTLLVGLESTTSALVDTLISAFFISLQDDEQGLDGGLTST